MDDLDRAKELEMQQRDESLRETLARPDHDYGEKADIVDGVHYCIDCCEPIPLMRLAVLPGALRCVDCKQDWENNKK